MQQYTRRGDSAPCPGQAASACACKARKWCGGNSTHSHHIVTPSIGGDSPSARERLDITPGGSSGAKRAAESDGCTSAAQTGTGATTPHRRMQPRHLSTRKTPNRSPSTIHPRRESGSTSPGRLSGAKRAACGPQWWECVSTPSSTAGDTCIFQSCPRLFRGHVQTLGAWAPEFGLYAHGPQTCVIVRSDRSAGCHCRARRTPMFETWVTGSRELAMPSRRAASTRHF